MLALFRMLRNAHKFFNGVFGEVGLEKYAAFFGIRADKFFQFFIESAQDFFVRQRVPVLRDKRIFGIETRLGVGVEIRGKTHVTEALFFEQFKLRKPRLILCLFTFVNTAYAYLWINSQDVCPDLFAVIAKPRNKDGDKRLV